jgi:hypothetical protein
MTTTIMARILRLARVNIRAMKRISLALVALACIAPARAADKVYAYEAETAAAAKRAAVTAGGVRWTCAGTRCTASGRGGNVSVKGCSELARQVGAVASYRSEVKRLGEGDLAECNRVAGAAPAAKNARPADKPQRATTGELTYTGLSPPARAAERKP